MTPPRFVLYLTWLFLKKIAQATNENFSSSPRQEKRFVSANVGDSLTLKCFYEHKDATRFYWYKQSLGQKPRLVSTVYMFNKNGTLDNEFKDNPRFRVDSSMGNNHLHITNLQISDSGTYFCARKVSLSITFEEGTLVIVKGSGLSIKALVHQSDSETVQQGDSVTLNCTIHTGTWDGEHRVYWFKDAEEPQPGLIYTNRDKTDQCMRENNKTHTCVYNLPIRSVNRSHAGIYYCAVASCGHIQFGNGTKLEFEDEVKSLVMVYVLSGALVFTTTLVVVLMLLLCKVRKKNSSHSDFQARFSAPCAEVNQDTLHYAALSVNQSRKSRRQKSIDTECVYSRVAQ
ncbi:immunoglobulin kappa light chain-like isoform X2 [Mugil cephalus]|uniref:immunoglobulin kappa light chain-like isoform X2 n=1 Tax=Mugil cephalus TaxID=48193 RepID=UPI001FB77B02|nr:immunoglobulin kappa light chain-like isoform X2 [Mugil cephalus]